MHVRWLDLPDHLDAVEVVLRVIDPPKTDHLHFWALQASFVDQFESHGAGHLGLQWIAGHPGNTAVNWGGYRDGGGELKGTTSDLPSSRGNVNTRDFDWTPESAYLLRIDRGPHGWRGTVTNTSTGVEVVVRELSCPGTHLAHVVMWSEIFAPCDAPATRVLWSAARAFTADGEFEPRFAVSYQSVADGGCSNTNTIIARAQDGSQGNGVMQRTNTKRTS